jgi:hypothetical protein
MQIAISKKTTTIINVENPSFLRQHGIYTAITDQFVVTTTENHTYVSIIPASEKQRYSDAIADALRYEPTSITQEEFDKVFNKSIKCLTEQYQSSIAMIRNIDPGSKQAEETQEQATDTQAAEATAEETAGDEVAAEE